MGLLNGSGMKLNKPTKDELEKEWNKLKRYLDFYLSEKDFYRADETMKELEVIADAMKKN